MVAVKNKIVVVWTETVGSKTNLMGQVYGIIPFH